MWSKLSKRERREAIEGYIAILPWIIGLLVFVAGPIVATFIISFCEWELLHPPKWIGFLNYAKLAEDPLFFQSMKVTLIYIVFSVPLCMIVALLTALLLSQKVKGLAVFRTIFYLPSILPMVAASILWIWIYNPEFGILNYFLGLVGIDGPDWLYSTTWILPAFIIMSLWSIGPIMIIFLAGLKNIPEQFYEAAMIDGANNWQKFWNITIPLLSPTIFFILITQTIAAFQTFVQPFVMGGGGEAGSYYGAPLNASLFYTLNLYQEGFKYFNMGYASALSWILTLIILLVTLIFFKSASRWVYYEAERR